MRIVCDRDTIGAWEWLEASGPMLRLKQTDLGWYPSHPIGRKHFRQIRRE